MLRYLRRLADARPRARSHDDPARLVHDEAQRDHRDDADHLAGVRRPPSVRPGRRVRRAAGADRRARRLAGRDHRLRRRQRAAQRRQPGRVRRAAGDPRLPPLPRRRAAHGLPDPVQRPRHERRQRGDGRASTWSSSPPTTDGNIDVDDLQAKIDDRPATASAAIMVTYPSTHGVFEEAHRRDLRRPCTTPAARSTSTAPTSTPSSVWPARARSAPTSATSTCTRRSASPTAAAVRVSGRSASAPTSPRSCPVIRWAAERRPRRPGRRPRRSDRPGSCRSRGRTSR